MHSLLTTSVLALAALPFTSAWPAGFDPSVPVGKAIYFLTNDQTNMVIALPIASDGTLSQGTSTATGGSGSNSIEASTGQPAAPDALNSQGSVTIAGNVWISVP